MLGGLLGSKFGAKCKHAVKCVNERLAQITRKKQAMLRFLKKDVADLVDGGFESNAFGRMDKLIVEINLVYCYDMLGKYCECLLGQLPTMVKKRECPEEATEAVATLIFAAAWFPDLPELCDIRRAISERYGTQMESYISYEFVEKLQKKSFSTDKKLELMQEIAKEFSIIWDFKIFKNKMSNSTLGIDQSKKVAPVCTGSIEPPVEQLNRENEGMNDAADRIQPKEFVPVCNGSIEPPVKQLNRENEGMNDAADRIQPKDRYESIPRLFVQKHDIRAEPKDIHVISGVNDHRTQDAAFKTSKVHADGADEPENVEPQCNNTLPLYSKWTTKDVHHGTCKNAQIGEALTPKRSQIAQQVGLVKLPGDKPVYTIPPYTKPNGNGASIGVREENQDDDVLSCKRSPRAAEEFDAIGHESQLVRTFNHNRDKSTNKAPPCVVKPKVDYFEAALQDAEKQQPRSVRSRHPNPTVMNEENGSIDDKYSRQKVNGSRPRGFIAEEVADRKPVSQTPTGQRRNMGSSSSATHDNDYYGRDMKFSLKGAIDEEVGNAIDFGKLMGRTTSPGKRARSGCSIAPSEVDYYGEGKATAPKEATIDRVHDAIDYGKLLPQTPSGQRRHASRRNATHGGFGDREEKVMDRLLMHYSKKGMSNKMETRSIAPHSEKNEESQYSNGRLHPSPVAKPLPHHERTISLPAEPAGTPKVVKMPVRAASMQRHPRMPDYDELAARIAALRNQ